MAKKKPKHKIASSDDYISTRHINVANGDKLKWSGTMREEKCKYKIWHLTTYACHWICTKSLTYVCSTITRFVNH
jgi:hypothetical protein